MSVIIRGMEMPKSCSECFVKSCKGRAKNKRLMVQRGEDCPLIPVPAHGDLIDKKTVSENLASVLNKKNPPFSYPDWNDAIVAMLTAPTIIPAEEGET